MTKQPLAIGIENYKEIIEKNYYYIDKSCMIKDLIEETGKSKFIHKTKAFWKDPCPQYDSYFFRKRI